MTEPTLHIHLFGPLELIQGNEPLPLPSSSKTRSLLAYLILHHDQAIPRDRLTGLFWPDRCDSRARRALSHALWQIRSELGDAASRLITEEDTVAFALRPNDWLDVAAFQDKTREYRDAPGETSHLNRAITTYRADFLEACYDDWALLERERLRELYLQTLERLITLYKQRGEYDQALARARRLAAADPLRESVHRELMQLYHLLGRHRAALAQYATLRQFLTEELDVEPAAATTTLYQEIVAALGKAQPPHLPVAAPPPPLLRNLAHLPFVGRAGERARLLDHLQATAHGFGGVMLIEGDAGVGKSRLIEEIAAAAQWRGFQVGMGKADPLTKVASYQLLRDALSPLLTPLRLTQLAQIAPPSALSVLPPLFPTLAQHLPDLPTRAPRQTSEGQERLWEGLGECLTRLSSISPLLLILEDVHGADKASLAALPHLIEHLSTGQACLLLSYRPFEAHQRPIVWETLQTLDHALPLLRLHLAPFERDEAAALVQRALGVSQDDAQAAAFAERLQDKTGGNGLFLVETLKLLLEAGHLEPSSEETSTGGAWRFPAADLTLPTPTSVQALIGERLARLTPDLRATLEQSAVLGEDTEFTVLLHADRSAPSAETLARRLRTLNRRGFLAETETGYRFEHDLTRQVTYQAIDPERQRILHHRAATALETRHPERVESLARHFDRSGEREQALSYTLQAGERAEAVYDYESALAHYRRAERLTENENENENEDEDESENENENDRWDALARQEIVLGILSRREEQAHILHDMLRLAESLDDPLRRARTLYRQGWREVLVGQPSQALSLLEEAAALAQTVGERNLRGTCLVAIARAWWRIGEMTSCQTAVEEAHALFQETNHHPGQIETLNMLGNLHLGMTGNYVQALRYFEALEALAGESDDRYREAAAQGNIGITYTVLGAYARSQQALTASLQVMNQVGDRHWQAIIHHWQAANHRGLGDTVRAREVAQEALQLCRQVGNRNFEIASLELLGLIELDRHAPEQARLHFQEAVTLAQANEQLMDWALNQSHLALTQLYLDHPEEARRLSEQAIATLETLEGHVGRAKEVYFERCQVLGTMEDLEQAYHHLQRMAAQIEDAALRQSFLEESRNRAISTAHCLGRIPPPLQQQTVSLPRADAPTGRPLREEEYVPVTWTVTAPEDGAIPETVARRRRQLLRLLREAAAQEAAPTVAILAATIGVSQRTIKRDLDSLRADGHEVHTRGSRSS